MRKSFEPGNDVTMEGELRCEGCENLLGLLQAVSKKACQWSRGQRRGELRKYIILTSV